MKLLNPLLYLISLGCLAAIGYSIWGVMKPKPALQVATTKKDGSKMSQKEVARAVRGQIRNNVDGGRTAGQRLEPDQGRWRYDGSPWWEQFVKVNIIGYVAPVVVEKKDTEEVKQPTSTQDIDMSTILEVMCIMYGDPTSAVIKYKGNVELPEALRPKMDTTSGGMGAMAGGTGGVGEVPHHHIKIGEALWKPHDKIVLRDVDKDAEFVVFELQDRKDKDGKHPTKKVHREVLGLSAEGYEDFLRWKDGKTAKAGKGTGEKPVKRQPTTSSKWDAMRKKDVTVIQDENVVLSDKDLDYIGKNTQQLVHRDIQMRDVSSGSGNRKIRGVQISKVSKRMAGIGVEAGDLIVSVNGVKVKGRAHAISVGKKLYRQDKVRVFRIGFYRRGQYMERVFHAKKDAK